MYNYKTDPFELWFYLKGYVYVQSHIIAMVLGIHMIMVIGHSKVKSIQKLFLLPKSKVPMIEWNTSTLLYPVSLLIGCWDWVQGGNPLYAAVKCLSVCRGQIWQIFFISFAKSTWHIHFLTSLFFGGVHKIYFPLKIGRFFWVPPLFQNWGPISKIEGPGCERTLGSAAVNRGSVFPKLRAHFQNWGPEGLGSPSMWEKRPLP